MTVDGADALGPRSKPLQHLRRLSGRRRARSAAGQFVIDGPTLVADALDAGVDVVEVYVEPGVADEVRRRCTRPGIDVRRVAAGALAKVTDPATPQGVAALANHPDPPPAEVLRGLVLVLVGVSDPGNAGTLLRAAEGAGASAVVSCADGVDLWSPKCVRASAGAVFRVPVVVRTSATQVLAELGAAGMTTMATSLGSAVSLDDVDLVGDVAVLLGNEAHGLPDEVVRAADVALSIPMGGRVESLNVAMAGTIVAFEAARQRRRAP